jgi:hypothetical protein
VRLISTKYTRSVDAVAVRETVEKGLVCCTCTEVKKGGEGERALKLYRADEYKVNSNYVFLELYLQIISLIRVYSCVGVVDAVVKTTADVCSKQKPKQKWSQKEAVCDER